MSDSPEIPESTRMANYVNRLIAGDFDGKTKQEIADALDVDRRTLHNWEKKLDWAYITAEKRKLYARDILEIDQSQIREAKKGSTQAAELVYRRFDGYVPTNAHEHSLATKSDEELKKMILEKQKQVVAEAASGPSGQGNPGTAQAGA